MNQLISFFSRAINIDLNSNGTCSFASNQSVKIDLFGM